MNNDKLLKQFEQALKENNVSRLLEGERPAPPQFGSIDILGRTHKTVIMDTQEGMADNLFCPELGWSYDNDPKNSESGHGTLHSHFAIPAIQEILPEGWRVATDPDWDTLIKFVDADAGTKLKSKEGWENNGGGTDKFGFRVLPSGLRDYAGSYFYNRGSSAYFWSSSANSSSYAWHRHFNYNYATVYRNNYNRSYGFSVRCVKDLK